MKSPLVVATLLMASFGGVLTETPAPTAPSTNVRYRFIGAAVRAMNEYETEYKPWLFTDGNSSSITNDNVEYTVAGNGLKGGWYRIVYARWIPHFGERVAAAGLTSSSGAVTLSIKGLPEGKHRLKTWHNAWDAIKTTAALNIMVDGKEVTSNFTQSIRVDNIWQAAQSYVNLTVTSADQTVQITFIPSGADNKVWLNGFEIDGPPPAAVINFPIPRHLDERIESQDGTVGASWTAAKISSPKYNIYLGKTETDLELVSSEQDTTGVIFEGDISYEHFRNTTTNVGSHVSGLNTFDTYYWRVDVISACGVHIGRVWMFRLAQLAFPGAEGYGRFARGGRGGQVVKVTSLDDTTDPGTLRYALLSVKGPRIIIFDVGGIITLKSRLSLNTEWGRYVTLAGQTAPGKGIVIQGYPIGLTGANDIIWRHIRVRPGKVSGVTVDGMGMAGSNYAIFDRCSVGWGIDESFSSRSAYNITFQRSMISEPLNVAGHKNYPEGTAHGYSATIGGDIGSFHHNLLAHAEGRSWSMGGGTDYNGNFAGRLDIRNNVVYNFGGRVNDGGAHKVNFVGNVYKQGPASSLTYAMKAQYEDGLPGTQQYYCAGNSMPGIFTQDSVQYVQDGTGQTKNIACYAAVTINPAPQYQKFFDQPFFESFVDTQTSTEAYKRVLSDSGASQPVQDDHDKRIVNETLTGTYTYTGSKTGKKGLIDDPADVGGLEDFPTTKRDADWDVDNNGIADWWDGSTGGEGWTPIEGYINWMADPHVFVSPSESVTVDIAPLATGFISPTFRITGATKGTASIDVSNLTYEAGPIGGIERLTLVIVDEDGSEWSRIFGVAIIARRS